MSVFREFLSLFFGRGSSGPPTRPVPVCPGCRRELTDVAKGQGLFRCSQCAGLWLNEDLFAWCLKAPEEAIAAVLDGSSGDHTFQRSAEARRCPACDTEMDNYPFGYQSGIWVDGCNHGHGIWLDAGELRLVRDFHARQQGPMTMEEKQRLAQAFVNMKLPEPPPPRPTPDPYGNYEMNTWYGSHS